MKTLIALLLLTASVQLQAAEVEILDYKDWRAVKVSAHAVSAKSSCVAKTSLKDKDIRIEVYSEASTAGGYVLPMVQIVGTDLPQALGVIFKTSPGKRDFPMTISLKETKMVDVEVLEEGSSIPVSKQKEQQVFIGRIVDSERMIKALRAYNTVTAVFYDATGEVAKEKFSLRGSSKTISTMMKECI